MVLFTGHGRSPVQQDGLVPKSRLRKGLPSRPRRGAFPPCGAPMYHKRHDGRQRELGGTQGRLVLRQFLGEPQELQFALVKVPPMG
jgi:hypothetical protein